MREANTLRQCWEDEVAMHAECCKVEVQRKEMEEMEEKEIQRKATVATAAEERAVKAIEERMAKAREAEKELVEHTAKAREAKKESVERSKGATEALKEQAEGAEKPAGSPNKASSVAFGIGVLVKSLHEPPTKAGGSSNMQDSGVKTTALSASDVVANVPIWKIRGMVALRLQPAPEPLRHKVSTSSWKFLCHLITFHLACMSDHQGGGRRRRWRWYRNYQAWPATWH